jgi:hypothetical protein
MKLRVGVSLALAAVAPAPRALASEPAAGTASEAPKTHGVVSSLGVGPGLFIANSGSAPDTRRYRGESVSFSFLLGGRVNRTLALGGGYLRDEIVDLRAKDGVLDGDEPNLSHVHFFTSVFGVFGDFLIPTRPELHAQGFIGYGSLFVDGRPLAAANVDNPSGFVYAGTLSAEFRVASDLTLGPALRLLLADFSVNETGVGSTHVSVLIPALMVTGRYD